MEEDEEETISNNLRKTSSTVTLIDDEDVSRAASDSTLIEAESENEIDEITTAAKTTSLKVLTNFVQTTSAICCSSETIISYSLPHCQIVTQQASGDSVESESESMSLKMSPSSRYSRITTPHSSSSQEEYDVPQHQHHSVKGKFLSAGQRTDTARSMESLKTTSRNLLSTSERDMRRIFSESTTEAKSLESMVDREMILKRHAVSGEGAAILSLSTSSEISAEKKRGLWSGKMRVPQHLSLPPAGGYLSLLSPGERRLTILSPHSPHRTPEFMSLTQQATLKARRKKANTILPRLVLPRSDSDISEVFSEHGLEDLEEEHSGELECKFGRRFLRFIISIYFMHDHSFFKSIVYRHKILNFS